MVWTHAHMNAHTYTKLLCIVKTMCRSPQAGSTKIKILKWSKLKAFQDDKETIAQIV